MIIFIAGSLFYFKRNKPQETVHFHAGFLVFIDGKQQDFSDLKYMHIEPCTDENTPHEEPARNAFSIADAGGDEQVEKAHLHENVGDVVHVHRNGAVWSDLFKNIGFPLPQENQIQGFLNGSPLNNILSYPIKAFDSVIIISGNTKDINLNQYVTKDHIREIENKSENCGS